MKKVLSIVTPILVIVLLILGAPIGTYNNGVNYLQEVKEQSSNIEVLQQRQFELIHNLSDIAKGSMDSEGKAIKEIIAERKANPDKDPKVNEIVTQLNVLLERYPELKTAGNFETLMTQLQESQNLIHEARIEYNNRVLHYNRFAKSPRNILFTNWVGFPDELEFFNQTEDTKAPLSLMEK